MTLEQLIKAAESIKLPCYVLNDDSSGKLSGIWGGEIENTDGYYVSCRDIINLDTSLLETLGIVHKQPLLRVIEHETEDGETSQSPGVTEGTFADLNHDGEPLYAHSDFSIPPVEALCLYGGAEVADWMQSMGLERWEYDIAVQRSEELSSYREHHREHSHELREDIAAVVGGWHIRWPEDDYYIPREARLAIWTFQDAEPWYEVFAPNEVNCFVKERIT